MIQFRKLIIHNFCSYGHSEIDLTNRGFCLVSGKNNYKKDNALSNGSGKSTWINAISACLTGETLNGLHSNFKNINIEEDSCYITLDFNVDTDSYTLTRIFNPKSDLKIIKNDIDISGKGIRESESILKDHLPDINKDLLGQSILIGQGFPNRFTALQPSKRKEALENLTHTDFMIEDVKTRVNNRQTELNSKIREIEDSILVKNTELNTTTNQLALTLRELETYSNTKPDFNTEIKSLEEEITNTELSIKENQTLLLSLSKSKEDNIASTESSIFPIDEKINKLSADQLALVTQRSTDFSECTNAYNAKVNELKEQNTNLYGNKIIELTHQISHIKSIKDTCPTCKQKLINVDKPDHRPLEEQLLRLQSEQKEFEKQFIPLKEKYDNFVKEITNAYADKLSSLDSEIVELKNNKSKLQLSLKTTNSQLESQIMTVNNLTRTLNSTLITLNSKLSTARNNQLNWDTKVTTLTDIKTNLTNQQNQINDDIKSYIRSKDELNSHLAVIKKMDTLIKRDFRGILLQNVIKYLDQTAKNYSNIVFGTTELSIYLDGNNLDVKYCGRLVEQLSGGERAKVDLIVQLAIRKMLQAYLNMTSNILVLDEVTDFLDVISCKSIMALINQELNTTESVFIISHMANSLEIPIDSELVVVKNGDGISEIQ